MNGFQPKIIAFLCNWCSYVAADAAGVSRMTQQPNVRVIRVFCSGMVDPGYVVKAFASGADGVLVAGCHPGDCHYISGNIKALRRARLLERLLLELGVEKGRFRLEWICRLRVPALCSGDQHDVRRNSPSRAVCKAEGSVASAMSVAT